LFQVYAFIIIWYFTSKENQKLNDFLLSFSRTEQIKKSPQKEARLVQKPKRLKFFYFSASKPIACLGSMPHEKYVYSLNPFAKIRPRPPVC
jgi:hypothetical protein